MTDTKDRVEDPAGPGRPGTPPHRHHLVRPAVIVPLVAVCLVLAGVAAYLFQPWKLVVDDVVDEPLPGLGAGARDGAARTVLASGRFVSHEHETTGAVRVLGLPGGERILRFDDFETSNGPALSVWITDADVVTGPSGWFVFDDGKYVDLGDLRGNVGSQNYPLPVDVDLDELTSVSIWCERFSVSFGAAELDPGR